MSWTIWILTNRGTSIKDRIRIRSNVRKGRNASLYSSYIVYETGKNKLSIRWFRKRDVHRRRAIARLSIILSSIILDFYLPHRQRRMRALNFFLEKLQERRPRCPFFYDCAPSLVYILGRQKRVLISAFKRNHDGELSESIYLSFTFSRMSLGYYRQL